MCWCPMNNICLSFLKLYQNHNNLVKLGYVSNACCYIFQQFGIGPKKFAKPSQIITSFIVVMQVINVNLKLQLAKEHCNLHLFTLCWLWDYMLRFLMIVYIFAKPFLVYFIYELYFSLKIFIFFFHLYSIIFYFWC
jgi:hypothetical protein